MTDQAQDSTNRLIAMIAWTIAHPSSHAQGKHLNEFKDAGFPPVLETPGQLRDHMIAVMNDKRASVVSVGDQAYIFHRPTQTVIVINPSPNGDGGTVFRNEQHFSRNDQSRREFKDWYEGRVKKVAERSGVSMRNVKKHECSFHTFLKSHPEAENILREGLTPIWKKKKQMDIINNRHNSVAAVARVAAAARKPVSPQRVPAPV